MLSHYEGLVFRTTQRYAGFVDEEFEDIQQILRLKIYRALLSYDSTKSNMTRDRYVFSCVVNQCKDLIKRRKRNEVYIEEIAPVHSDTSRRLTRDYFEAHYLCVEQHQEYGAVEDDDLVIPSTLTGFEREIVVHLYLHFTSFEIAERLDCPKREVDKAVRSLKDKMSDWRPTREEPTVVLVPIATAA